MDWNYSTINESWVFDIQSAHIGGDFKYNLYDLASAGCTGINDKLYLFTIVILILYLLSNILQNKLDRGKWFNLENPPTFRMYDMRIIYKYPFFEITAEQTDIKQFCYDYIIPIMKMTIYCLMIWNIFYAHAIFRG